jgi:hypothetical protein
MILAARTSCLFDEMSQTMFEVCLFQWSLGTPFHPQTKISKAFLLSEASFNSEAFRGVWKRSRIRRTIGLGTLLHDRERTSRLIKMMRAHSRVGWSRLNQHNNRLGLSGHRRTFRWQAVFFSVARHPRRLPDWDFHSRCDRHSTVRTIADRESCTQAR